MMNGNGHNGSGPLNLNRGTAINERDAFVLTLEGLNKARDGLRCVAQLRGDLRWLYAVRVLEQVIDNVKRNMNARATKPLLTIARDEARGH